MNTCWVWCTPCEYAESLILAGGTLFAGGNGRVVACSAADGQLLWTGFVNGRACSLLVAQGQLIVSTDAGCIQCFQPQETPTQPLAEQRTPAQGAVAAGLNLADPASEESARLDDLARLLLAQSHVDQGFGLIIGAGHTARTRVGIQFAAAVDSGRPERAGDGCNATGIDAAVALRCARGRSSSRRGETSVPALFRQHGPRRPGFGALGSGNHRAHSSRAAPLRRQAHGSVALQPGTRRDWKPGKRPWQATGSAYKP